MPIGWVGILWWWGCMVLDYQFSSVQSLSCVRLFATPWTAAHQTSLSTHNSWSLFKLIQLRLELKLRFSSPVATAEFSTFAAILSAALSQHHILGFEIAQLEFHHLTSFYVVMLPKAHLTSHSRMEWTIQKHMHNKVKVSPFSITHSPWLNIVRSLLIYHFRYTSFKIKHSYTH